ncbi:LIC_10190 family membrane protein [Chryseobacterium sp. MP_3.2]|uniref:LIC_10190 family membrane protein n=1 Tax=Chryseobacterium sp. MP_3.2 TaxID=3071712 RepID=UPI002E0303B8|nr:hypothetical protein [Chryseobacterium sp. MP_3.2]
MLYILFMLILLLPALAGIGVLVMKITRKKDFGISGKLLTGIVSTSVIWTVVAFLFPLNLTVELITLTIGILSFFYFKVFDDFWAFFATQNRAFLLIAVLIVIAGSYFPFILDHFGYYVPTIKWISEVGLVQGISNLDLLLGQMSFWHIFQAGFSHFADPFLRINVLVLIIFQIYIFEKKSWTLLAFIPFCFLFVQSPSPDLAAIAFSLMILNEIFRCSLKVGFLFTFCMFIFALKPTVLWLPILVFLYGIFVLKASPKIFVPGFAILLLFCFKNIWTFGFPIFPVQVFDFGFAWTPNDELLNNSSQMAIRKTFDLKYTYNQIQQFSLFDYIKNWFFLPGIKGVIHSFFILSLLVLFIFALRKKSKLIWLVFIAVSVKSILVLLFSAQYRFFFEVFFVVAFLILNEMISKKTSLLVFTLGSIFFLVFLSFPNLVQKVIPSFRLGQFMIGFTKDQFYKPAYFELHDFETHQIGNLNFNIVKNYPFSFDTPLPAISPQFIQEDLDAGIFPQLKGKTLKEGFIWRKISAEEKIELEKILNHQY